MKKMILGIFLMGFFSVGLAEVDYIAYSKEKPAKKIEVSINEPRKIGYITWRRMVKNGELKYKEKTEGGYFYISPWGQKYELYDTNARTNFLNNEALITIERKVQ